VSIATATNKEKTMINANLISHAPAWKLAIIHYVAKALGVLVKVEGIPFGSNRNIKLHHTGNTSA
jgi:hypothetical protein